MLLMCFLLLLPSLSDSDPKLFTPIPIQSGSQCPCTYSPLPSSSTTDQIRLYIQYPASCTSSRQWNQSQRLQHQNAKLLSQLLIDSGIPSPATLLSPIVHSSAINTTMVQTQHEHKQAEHDAQMHDATTELHDTQPLEQHDAPATSEPSSIHAVSNSASVSSVSDLSSSDPSTDLFAQCSPLQQWTILIKECRVISMDASRSKIRLSISFTTPAIATHLLHALSSAGPEPSASSARPHISAEQPRVQLLTGYINRLPARIMQYPYDGALEKRASIFEAAPHVQWHDSMDTILSLTYFGRTRMQFVVEPCYVKELFAVRERVKHNCGVRVGDRIRFTKLLNPEKQCCSHCLQVGHSKSRCNKLAEQRQQAQQASQHLEDGTDPDPCCPTCHDFHPYRRDGCMKAQAACTLCGRKDHIVTKCKLYRPREVEITEQSERQIQARQDRRAMRVNSFTPNFTRDASVFSSHFPSLSRSTSSPSSSSTSVASGLSVSPSSATSYASVARPLATSSVSSGLPSPINSPMAPFSSTESDLLKELRQMREEHNKQMQQMMQQQQQQQLQQMQLIQQLRSDMQKLSAELAESREKEAKAARECVALKRKVEQLNRAAQQGSSKVQRTNTAHGQEQEQVQMQAAQSALPHNPVTDTLSSSSLPSPTDACSL